MESKYIELLINNCLNLKNKKSLFIHYSKEVETFVRKLTKSIKSQGINDIYFDVEDIYEIHDFLKENNLENIKKSKLFNQSIWDEYAKKNASFLILETEYPGVMDDIPEEKIGLSSKIKRESRPLYRKKVEKCELDWCIAAYPGKLWAKHVFPNNNDSYNKLKQNIFNCCMLNVANPSKSWNDYLNKQSKIIKYLNNIKIEKLVYTNNLGTNLTIYLPDNYLYSSAKDRNVIVNMPSYEVFTSPIYNKTEGIVYSSKPLMYNGGLVNEFWIKFKEGKVIDYDAKIGRDILKSIIESDNNSCYLGECALVEKRSPIAKKNIVFGTTLFDENASCHLALGAGFPECIKNGLNLTNEELLTAGINISTNHVDFMIGTDDLKITAFTKDKKEIPIFIDGIFSKEILNNYSNERIIN